MLCHHRSENVDIIFIEPRRSHATDCCLSLERGPDTIKRELAANTNNGGDIGQRKFAHPSTIKRSLAVNPPLCTLYGEAIPRKSRPLVHSDRTIELCSIPRTVSSEGGGRHARKGSSITYQEQRGQSYLCGQPSKMIQQTNERWTDALQPRKAYLYSDYNNEWTKNRRTTNANSLPIFWLSVSKNARQNREMNTFLEQSCQRLRTYWTPNEWGHLFLTRKKKINYHLPIRFIGNIFIARFMMVAFEWRRWSVTKDTLQWTCVIAQDTARMSGRYQFGQCRLNI